MSRVVKPLHRANVEGRLPFSSQACLFAALEVVMATQPLSPGGLKLQLEEKPNETIIHCKGKISAENLEVFQREVRDLIYE